VLNGGLFLAHKILELPPTIAAALVAATVAPVGSVTSLAVGRYYERKKIIEQEIRAQKTAVYEGLLEVWTQMFLGDKMDNRTTGADGELTPEFVRKTIAVNRGLVIWSNQEVLSRWSRLRRLAAVKGSDIVDYVASLEVLMRSIREDIGHSNRKLAQGDIMGLFINDIPVPPDAPVKKSIAKAAVDELTRKKDEK
jgi:hypothetical protein